MDSIVPKDRLPKNNAGDRIRTCVDMKPIAPEAIPFDHSGTPAQESVR